jgi:hypothetical protein
MRRRPRHVAARGDAGGRDHQITLDRHPVVEPNPYVVDRFHRDTCHVPNTGGGHQFQQPVACLCAETLLLGHPFRGHQGDRDAAHGQGCGGLASDEASPDDHG